MFKPVRQLPIAAHPAPLMEDNPTARRLKELETLVKVAEKIDKISECAVRIQHQRRHDCAVPGERERRHFTCCPHALRSHFAILKSPPTVISGLATRPSPTGARSDTPMSAFDPKQTSLTSSW
jgi:hypothetical protein